MTAELPDTEQARAVYAAIKRGDLSQMSFAFDIGECTFDEQTQTRTITQISKIYEISIVNYAAYTQTNVQARAGKETEKDGKEVLERIYNGAIPVQQKR